MSEQMRIVDDNYIWSPKRKILTSEQLKIGGLEMIGHSLGMKKTQPLPTHIHNTREFVYVVNGSQTYVVDEKEFVVNSNSVFISKPMVKHGTGNIVHDRYEIFWFRLSDKYEDDFLHLDKQAGKLLFEAIHAIQSDIVTFKGNRKSLIAKSFELLSGEDKAKKHQGCMMLIQFLWDIVNSSNEDKSVSPQITAALDYIGENIFEVITISELAQISGLSLSRFKTRFKHEVQISPGEYINIRKINKAKDMLANTSVSITEISFELNFSSSHYFSVVFKQFVGMTPSQYREQKSNP